MPDLAFEDLVQGATIVTFDGHVLEVFTQRVGSACGLVRGMLHLDLAGPDRRGKHVVKVTSMPSGRGGGVVLTVAEEVWPAVEAWFASVRAGLET